MRCLNSPSVLNSLEAKIVESAPGDAKHVLVVNAGDGRLGRAIREKLGGKVACSAVTLQPGLERFVDDFSAHTSAPWDLAWYKAQVKAHGPFDYVVFYQLQEFWQGQLFQFDQVLQLARPGAVVWTSFLNAQSNRLIARFLPPVQLGFSALADPFRSAANIDFASFIDFGNRTGRSVVELWGLLDPNAQEYCQKQPSQPVRWETRGVKVSVSTLADAFLWGAAVVGVALQIPGGATPPPATKISFSPYSANLLQALVLPYPDHQTKEGILSAASLEVAGWRKAPMDKLGPLVSFFLKQVGDTDKPRRVLLAGSGWGRDLLVLKRHFPTWEWVGFDHNADLVALGRDMLGEAGLTAESGDLSAPLPFDDRSFDMVVSLGYFSGIYEPAGRHLAKELRRVSRGPVYHLEDGRGPEQGMQLKSYSLKAAYSELGADANVQPVLVDGAPNGMYMLKVAPAA